MTPVVLAVVDVSREAHVALPVAKRLAALEGARLHLVHGDSPAEIVKLAKSIGATRIVLSTHAARGSSKTIGRTALGVLAHAACPVVLVRPERGAIPWELRRILLPHDGTPTTSAAIAPAAALARAAGAELFVLHVADPEARPPAERGSMTAPRYTDQPQHEWPAWAGEFLERLGCVCPLEDVKVRMALAHGEPGAEVLRYATEHASDLVVLAWRGDWKRKHAITTKKIVRHTPCPVLVVRADR